MSETQGSMMPIGAQTERRLTRQFSHSTFPSIEPSGRLLLRLIERIGLEKAIKPPRQPISDRKHSMGRIAVQEVSQG